MITYNRTEIINAINNAYKKGITKVDVIACLMALLYNNEHRNIFYSDELSFREEDFINRFN